MAMLTRSAGNRSQQDASPALPVNPSVNLLPPETVERKRARTLVRRFVLAGVGVAASAPASGWPKTPRSAQPRASWSLPSRRTPTPRRSSRRCSR